MTELPTLRTRFNGLYEGSTTPTATIGEPYQPFAYTPAMVDAARNAAERIVSAIVDGKSVKLFFDNDGTGFPFVKNPKDVKIDPGFYRALVRAQAISNVIATSLSGRDVHEAREIMLTPGHEVKDAAGNVLAEEGDKSLRFGIIGSHGVAHLGPDNADGTEGKLTQYEFPAEAQRFIETFQAYGNALVAGGKYPGIVFEQKHGSFGLNVASMEDREQAQQVLAEFRERMIALVQSDENPTDAATGLPTFETHAEGKNEFEIRPNGGVFGKEFGIRTFGNVDPDALTIFACDSLTGTDKSAATLVGKLPNGVVIQVGNGRIPFVTEGENKAHVHMGNAGMLGDYLNLILDRVEEICAIRFAHSPGVSRPSPYTAAAPRPA